MKKFFTTILSLAIAAVMAQAAVPSLTVVYAEGEPAVYAISDVKRIEIGANDLTMVTAAETYNVALADIKSLELGVSEITGLSDADLQALGFAIVNGTIQVTNAPAGAQINVFNLSGVMVLAAQCDADGNATIDASSLPTGAYLLAINKFTQKFIIR